MQLRVLSLRLAVLASIDLHPAHEAAVTTLGPTSDYTLPCCEQASSMVSYFTQPEYTSAAYAYCSSILSLPPVTVTSVQTETAYRTEFNVTTDFGNTTFLQEAPDTTATVFDTVALPSNTTSSLNGTGTGILAKRTILPTPHRLYHDKPVDAITSDVPASILSAACSCISSSIPSSTKTITSCTTITLPSPTITTTTYILATAFATVQSNRPPRLEMPRRSLWELQRLR